MELQRWIYNHTIVDDFTCYGSITVAKMDY